MFYAFQNAQCLPVLIASIIANYAAGISIINLKASGQEKLSRLVFITGLVFNAGLLGFFKYSAFIVSTINKFGVNIPVPDIILPPGISFFTITEIIYLVDVHQGVAKDKDLVKFALFVSFFPHILAGPILWHKPMIKQFSDPDVHKVNWENIAKGLTLFVIGLAKKVIVADQIAPFVNECFAEPEGLTVLNGIAAIVYYTIQLYFDFSGYSDMAVGIAKMMNIDIPVNFNSPYKAYGMIDYWSRWHMSLTQAITNYIYTPIVRSFSEITFGRAMFATFTAMLIAGIWHGAGWTFIIFGALHGLGLVLNHIWKKYKLWMPKPLGYALMWLLILTANVFFRAESVSDALSVLYGAIGGRGLMWSEKASRLAGMLGINISRYSTDFHVPMKKFMLMIMVILFLCPNSNEIAYKKFRPSWLMMIFTLAMLLVSFYNFSQVTDFLYLNF